MKLRLVRKYLKETYTVGKLYYYNENSKEWVYFCDTLEDKVRDLNKDGDLNDSGEGKVYGKTAIPYGTYRVDITLSPKFQRYLPLLIDVEHFKYIRIHAGNSIKDTDGCILVGENKVKGGLVNSLRTLDNLMDMLNKSTDKYHSIEIV